MDPMIDLVIIILYFMRYRKNCYLVMDLRCGGDLRYYLRKRKIFEEVDVAFYIACMSSALEHIHSKNIIHRDIKPGDNGRIIINFVLYILMNPLCYPYCYREYNPGSTRLSPSS